MFGVQVSRQHLGEIVQHLGVQELQVDGLQQCLAWGRRGPVRHLHCEHQNMDVASGLALASSSSLRVFFHLLQVRPLKTYTQPQSTCS